MDRSPIRALLTACALPFGAAVAHGDRAMPSPVPPAYATECGSCHIPYPPGLLPAASWRRIVDGLDRHYGTDAAPDAVTARELGAWLTAHAGTSRRTAAPPPEDRITRTDWFARKHRGVEAGVWKLPSVRSAANCGACHLGAQRGRFDDDALRVPVGLSRSQRQAWKD